MVIHCNMNSRFLPFESFIELINKIIQMFLSQLFVIRIPVSKDVYYNKIISIILSHIFDKIISGYVDTRNFQTRFVIAYGKDKHTNWLG